MTICPRYWVGETVRLRMRFATESGAALNPSGIEVKIWTPAAEELTLTATAESVGSYYADIQATLPGTWSVLWVWSGPAPSVAPQSFVAIPTTGA